MDAEAPEGRRTAPGADLGAFVSVAAAGAGVMRLAMVPGRGRDAAAVGVLFGALAVAQFAAAWVARGRAGARTWQGIVLVEALALGWWIGSWTIGLPFGPRHGAAETVRLADVVVFALEALVLVTALVAVVAPDSVARARQGGTRRTTLVVGGLVAVAAVAALLTDGALDGRVDDAGAAAPSPAPTTSGPARARAAGIDDQPGATLVLPGDPSTSRPPTSASGTGPAATGAGTGPAAAPTTTSLGDRGFAALLAGRRTVADVAIDATTRTALAEQLAATAALVTRVPTIAAAEAAGYRLAGPFSPGTGTPYAPPRTSGNLDGRIDPGDIAEAVLLFDGRAPTSRLAGFALVSTRAQTDGEPAGFAGPNDHWSYVLDVCQVVDAAGATTTPFGFDRSVSRAQCLAAGGTLLAGAGFVLHVWTVPGYEVAEGIFRDLNPAITCPDGTYFVKGVEAIDTTGTRCRS